LQKKDLIVINMNELRGAIVEYLTKKYGSDACDGVYVHCNEDCDGDGHSYYELTLTLAGCNVALQDDFDCDNDGDVSLSSCGYSLYGLLGETFGLKSVDIEVPAYDLIHIISEK
jgi:hypothetical protein